MQITWFCERDIEARPKRKRKRTHFSLIDVSALIFLVSTAYLSAPQVAEKLPSLFDADCCPSERDPIFQMSRRQKKPVDSHRGRFSQPTDRPTDGDGDDVIIYLLRRRLLCICMIVSSRSAIILAATAAAAAATVESLCFRNETNKVQTRG